MAAPDLTEAQLDELALLGADWLPTSTPPWDLDGHLDALTKDEREYVNAATEALPALVAEIRRLRAASSPVDGQEKTQVSPGATVPTGTVAMEVKPTGCDATGRDRIAAEAERASFALSEAVESEKGMRRRLDSAQKALDVIASHDGSDCLHASPTDCLFFVAEVASQELGAAPKPHRQPQEVTVRAVRERLAAKGISLSPAHPVTCACKGTGMVPIAQFSSGLSPCPARAVTRGRGGRDGP